MTNIIFNCNGKEYKIDKALADILKKGVDNIDTNDDLPILLIGKERSGKSKFRDLIAGYMSSLTGVPFSLDDIHFSIYDYMDKSFKNKKKAINSHDEARRDLNVKRSMAKSSVDFTNYVSECGSQNQIHIIILPALSDIDKYIALWRAKLIIEIRKVESKITKKQLRMWRIIKTKNKSKLEMYYKFKYMQFKPDMILIKGTFEDNDIINEEAYEKKKSSYREQKYGTEGEKVKQITPEDKENEMIYVFKYKGGLTWDKMSEILGKAPTTLKDKANKYRRMNLSSSS